MTQPLSELVEQFCNFSASSEGKPREASEHTDGTWSSSWCSSATVTAAWQG
jgi:hypothetical protein